MKGGITMKTKRILALLGALLLLAMYASTLIFALIDSPRAQNLLTASIVCTVIFPILLYGYALVYRITRPSSDDKSNLSADTPDKKQTDSK